MQKVKSKNINHYRVGRRVSLILLVALTIVAIAAVLSGCGNSEKNNAISTTEFGTVKRDDISAARETDEEAEHFVEPKDDTDGDLSTPVETVVEQAKIDLKAGPVFWVYNNYGLSIEQIDLTTGERVEIFPNIGKTTIKDLNFASSGDHLGGWANEQMFDAKLEKMVVSWTEQSDDSTHVGWIDRNGELTDVTAIVSASESEFAARPRHKNPLFTNDGMFFFVAETQSAPATYSLFDPNTMSLVGSPVEFDYSSYAYDHFGSLVGCMFGMDGQMMGRRLNGSDMSVYDLRLPNGTIVQSSSMGWKLMEHVGDDKALMMSKKAIAIIHGGDDASNATALTPETDYNIDGATASGNQIAFTAYRGNEHTLFVVPVEGGQPKKVADLEDGDGLMFWK
jgi:hypothetical protein